MAKRVVREWVSEDLFELGSPKVENAVFAGIKASDMEEAYKIVARCLHKYVKGEWDYITEEEREHNKRQIAKGGLINVKFRTEIGTLRIMTSDDRVETLVKMA